MLGLCDKDETLGRGRRRRSVISYASYYEDEDCEDCGGPELTARQTPNPRPNPRVTPKADDRQRMMRKKRARSICSASESEISESEVLPERPDATPQGDETAGGTERLLMRGWLKMQVEAGTVAGLQYHDRSKELIRIPWIHASRQCWKADRHSELFRRWAIHTGRFSSHLNNTKKWKANFRCALNSLPDVEELPQLRKKGQNAYKVYRLKSPLRRETILVRRHKSQEIHRPDSEIHRPDSGNTSPSPDEHPVAMDVDYSNPSPSSSSCCSSLSPAPTTPGQPDERHLPPSPVCLDYQYTHAQSAWPDLPKVEAFDHKDNATISIDIPSYNTDVITNMTNAVITFSEEQYQTFSEILRYRISCAPEASMPELLPEIVPVELTELTNVSEDFIQLACAS